MSKAYELHPNIATLIAQCCVYQNKLPQGAPTSPVVSNIIAGPLDRALRDFCRNNHCWYSRYADDLTISTYLKIFPESLVVSYSSRHEVKLSNSLLKIVEDAGFTIQNKKTCLMSRHVRQKVTGLVVNRFVNIPREYIRLCRAILNNWRKNGLEHAAQTMAQREGWPEMSQEETNRRFKRSIMGMLSHIKQVKGSDSIVYENLLRKIWQISPELSEIDFAPEDTTKQSVWIIESGSLMTQATAFFISESQTVTCDHVFETDPGDVVIYQSDNAYKKYPITRVKSDPDRDLAIWEAQEELPAIPVLTIGSTEGLAEGDTVVLMGYPDYRDGEKIFVASTQITQLRVKSGIRSFSIQQPIVSGNSGGPVFDTNYEVVGIAATGIMSELQTGDTTKYGVIRIEHLRDLIGQ